MKCGARISLRYISVSAYVNVEYTNLSYLTIMVSEPNEFLILVTFNVI
jgi:hypothetical protein